MRFAAFVLLAACGARTDLGGHVIEDVDASAFDASIDHGHDAGVDVIIGVDVVTNACDDFTNDPTPQATTDLGTACDEGENTTSPPTTGCGTSGVAWEWVPDHDMAVSRIELWTEGGNQVAFYGDDNGHPGAQLFLGSTGGPDFDPPMWRGADVNPPIAVRGCHRYYLHQVLSHGSACSWSVGGIDVREYWNDGNGWQGPFPGHWMARVRGACQ